MRIVGLYKRLLRRLVDARWLVAAGHYGWPAPLIVAVAMRFMPTLGAAYVLAPLLLVGLVMLGVHAAGICPRCAPGMVPTFPDQEVERARTALRWLHRPLRQPVTWLVAAVHLLISFGAGGVYGRWSWVTVVVAFGGEMWAIRRHARLRPWCPYCRGKGPDEQTTPSPDGPGGLALDPTPTSGPIESGLTVADLQARWRGRPAPAEPAGPRPDSPIRLSGDAPTGGGAW